MRLFSLAPMHFIIFFYSSFFFFNASLSSNTDLNGILKLFPPNGIVGVMRREVKKEREDGDGDSDDRGGKKL